MNYPGHIVLRSKVCFQNAIQRTAQSQGRPTHIAYSFLLTLDHADIPKCRNKFCYHTLYSSSVPSQIYSLCVPKQPNRASVSFNTEKTITRSPCYPREKVETNKQKTPKPRTKTIHHVRSITTSCKIKKKTQQKKNPKTKQFSSVRNFCFH